jgi:hypothetical protein
MEKWEDGIKKSELEKIKTDLLKEHPREAKDGRGKELANALVQALSFMADRIDRGVDLEARVEYSNVETTDEEEGDGNRRPKESAETKLMVSIRSRGAILSGLQRDKDPVLRLTDGERKQLEDDKPDKKNDA